MRGCFETVVCCCSVLSHLFGVHVHVPYMYNNTIRIFFFKLYAFILLTSTLVPAINYFVVYLFSTGLNRHNLPRSKF